MNFKKIGHWLKVALVTAGGALLGGAIQGVQQSAMGGGAITGKALGGAAVAGAVGGLVGLFIEKPKDKPAEEGE